MNEEQIVYFNVDCMTAAERPTRLQSFLELLSHHSSVEINHLRNFRECYVMSCDEKALAGDTHGET
jgi:hypothetical protein